MTIVNYGAGNLDSVAKTFAYLGATPEIADRAAAMAGAERIVLPGVGAAGAAMRQIRERGMDEALHDAVMRRGVPMLGICLGMQLLAERLHEHGTVEGLGWLPGDVERIGGASAALRVPHMGWSGVDLRATAAPFFEAARGRKEFYFAHSFALRTDPSIVAATVGYGNDLTAAILKDNLFAVQFHPEKSQRNGQALLQAFLDWKP